MSKADLIIHPARLRIIQEFAPAEHLTAQELALRLADVPRATLYRHLAALVEGGILRVAEVRPIRAVEERIYALAEGAANVGPKDYDVTDPADHLRYFTTFLGLVRADFQRYLAERPHPDLPGDGVAYYQVPLNLSDSEYRRVVGAVTAVLKPLLPLRPSPKRRRRLFTFITVPGLKYGGSRSPNLGQASARDGPR
ncbi:MAG: helix-turn-helix domain-containing protein [Candidatus Dormibacteraceae bacterium]